MQTQTIQEMLMSIGPLRDYIWKSNFLMFFCFFREEIFKSDSKTIQSICIKFSGRHFNTNATVNYCYFYDQTQNICIVWE